MSRILIADDSLFMRTCLKALLEGAGHQVIGEACTGLEAIAQYDKLSPDLVTMDITMPRLSGVDALRHILELDKNAAVIMFTSNSKPEMATEMMKTGAKRYLTKPLDKEYFLQVVDEVTSGIGAAG